MGQSYASGVHTQPMPTRAATNEHPCDREPHCTSDDVRPPAAAVTQQEVPLPALCRFETRDDEGRYEWQPRYKQPQCTSNGASPPSAAATQQEDDVSLPALCRFETREDEGRYEWQPRCKQPSRGSRDGPESGIVGDRLQVPLSQSCDSKKTLKRVYNAASNCIEVLWTIPEKKLSIKDKAFTSPDFEIWEGGTFKLSLRSCPDNVKGGLHGARGVGRVELKFEGGTEFTGKVRWRVSVGQNKELPLEGLDHNFATRPQSILQQEWNFLIAVTRGSLLLHLEASMEERHECCL